MDNQYARQLALEAEMTGLGQRRVQVTVVEGKTVPDSRRPGQTRHKQSHQQAHTEHMTGYGRSLISTSIERVGMACEEFANATGSGRGASSRLLLRRFWGTPPARVKDNGPMNKEEKAALAAWEADKPAQMRVVALIGLEGVMAGVSAAWKSTRTAMSIGRNLEAQLKFRHAKRCNPALFTTVLKDLERREPNMKRRASIMNHSIKGDDTGQALRGWTPFTAAELATLGYLVLTIIAEQTTLISLKVAPGRNRIMPEMVRATPDTVTYINEWIEDAGWVRPMFLPTIIPPLQWDTIRKGGYYGSQEVLSPVRLVKALSGRNKEAVEQFHILDQAKMPAVYRATNAVQATAWRINKPLLAVLSEAWYKGGIAIGKMPVRTTAETMAAAFPMTPKAIEGSSPEEIQARNRVASKVYAAREAQIGRVYQMEHTILLAEKFADEQAIYFPTQLDFRGRMYPMPSILNPQGTDTAKGLLEFAEGKRFGASGWRWLHIHIANMHGEDKVSYDQREQWTMNNMDWIIACVKEPFTNREWMDADKPWQFMAAAIELAAAVESGDYENYVSHLPVTVDGTCNGLQHFSAMLLDADGANSVNLAPSEVPSDIYQIVANKVKAKFVAMDEPLAKEWLAWGFDRKATKRAVMILPYSGTQHAATEYIREYVKERSEKEPHPFEDEFAATQFFSTHVWKTIGETITSAGAVMKWLKSVAKAVTDGGRTIRWTTPMGFPVQQDNRDQDQFRVDLILGGGQRYRAMLRKDSERLDRRAQAQGISPNFIHSLDAACLMLTINRALDEGITSFAMVHDSYGVHACEMDKLYVGLRQAFVDVYQGDVMGNFVREATNGLTEEVRNRLIAEQPAKGTFQLELVNQSQYFFA